ncbi:hypothetical protein, partial [Streptomyces sp. NPDC049915]|uniref:hypothetical protein n=1 Tax=Streptomyces sp. NPDC049915 TaxID=3155510 RepID=UPI003443CB56
MVVTDRHIGYGGPGDDISHDARLDGISDALGQAEGVIEADARIASGASLQLVLYLPRSSGLADGLEGLWAFDGFADVVAGCP